MFPLKWSTLNWTSWARMWSGQGLSKDITQFLQIVGLLIPHLFCSELSCKSKQQRVWVPLVCAPATSGDGQTLFPFICFSPLQLNFGCLCGESSNLDCAFQAQGTFSVLGTSMAFHPCLLKSVTFHPKCSLCLLFVSFPLSFFLFISSFSTLPAH